MPVTPYLRTGFAMHFPLQKTSGALSGAGAAPVAPCSLFYLLSETIRTFPDIFFPGAGVGNRCLRVPTK
jgi:hypothetical protein